MNRDFNYKLIKLTKRNPVDAIGQFDGKPFRYDCFTKPTSEGVLFIVTSKVFETIGTLKMFESTSEYLIPYEQRTSGQIGNYVYAELVYQHLSRDCDTIYLETKGNSLKVPPTLKTIFDSLVVAEN